MNHTQHETLPDGTPITWRPVSAQDDTALEQLIGELSASDRRWRFHGMVNAVTPSRLQDMTHPVWPHELTCVAIAHDRERGTLVADARCVVDETGDSAEFALMVAAGWRRMGIGERTLGALGQAAFDHGLRWLHGSVLEDNAPMLALMRRCGFHCTPSRRGEGLMAVEVRTACLGADMERHAVRTPPAASWPSARRCAMPST